MANQGEVQLRYANIGDIPMFLTLFTEVIGGLSDYYNEAAINAELKKFTAEYISGEITQNGKAILLSTIGHSFVGFCITKDQCGPIWLEWYGVLPSFRRHHIGRKLLEHLISEARLDDSTTKIWCSTRTNNSISMHLLDQAGFRQLCRLDNHWHKQDYFLWEKMLRAA